MPEYKVIAFIIRSYLHFFNRLLRVRSNTNNSKRIYLTHKQTLMGAKTPDQNRPGSNEEFIQNGQPSRQSSPPTDAVLCHTQHLLFGRFYPLQ